MAEVTRHLKKQHERELERCSTCSRFFLTRGDLHAHPNDPIGCRRRGPLKGCGQQTLWFDLYALLFPETPLPPSPYYPHQSYAVHPRHIASTNSHSTATLQPEGDDPEYLPKLPGCIAASPPSKGIQVVGDLQKTIETSVSRQSPRSRARSLRTLHHWLTEQLSLEKDQPSFPHGHGNVAAQSQDHLLLKSTGPEAGAMSMQFQYEPEPQISVHLRNPESENPTTDHLSHYTGASQGASGASRNGPPLDQFYSALQWNQQDLPLRFQGDPGHQLTDGDSKGGWDNINDLEFCSSAVSQSSYHANYPGWMPHDRFQS